MMSDRAKKNRKRKHRADRDAPQESARSNDHPSISLWLLQLQFLNSLSSLGTAQAVPYQRACAGPKSMTVVTARRPRAVRAYVSFRLKADISSARTADISAAGSEERQSAPDVETTPAARLERRCLGACDRNRGCVAGARDARGRPRAPPGEASLRKHAAL